MLLLIILSLYFTLPWILQHFIHNIKASVTYVCFPAFIENTFTFNIWQPSSTLTHHSIAHAREYFHILCTKANLMYICLPLHRTCASWEKLAWDVLLNPQWALDTNSIIQPYFDGLIRTKSKLLKPFDKGQWSGKFGISLNFITKMPKYFLCLKLLWLFL